MAKRAYGSLPRSRNAGTIGRRILNPWGNNVAQPSARKANASGVTPGSARSRGSGTARKRANPAADLFKMAYKANDPVAWPIEGGMRGSISAMSQDKADFHNAAVNQAYLRTTGLS